jgi:IS30 family transposase
MLRHLVISASGGKGHREPSAKGGGLGGMPNAISIAERPASVANRAIPRHWEGDLIEGSNTTCIATLLERHSRYLALIKLKNKRTDTVVEALIKQSKKIPAELYKSLTWDRGTTYCGETRCCGMYGKWVPSN